MLTNVKLARLHPIPDNIHLRKNEFVFIPGMKLDFCSNCGSPRIQETDTDVKCLDCGMGKNKSGKR